MSSEKNFYKLRVNINGFELKDVKVKLVDQNDVELKFPRLKHQETKLRLKISANRNEFDESHPESTCKSTKEYVKYFEILTKSNVDPSSMRFYLDPKNPLYLVVEFVSNLNECFYLNLDDSCDSLVETAAKSLLNIKNIEDLRKAIENPFDALIDNQLTDIFSPHLIRDINMASIESFTPVKISDDLKKVQINVNIPYMVKSASIDNSTYKDSFQKISTNLKSIENLLEQPGEFELKNHLTIKCNNLNLLLEANTCKDNMTSLFTKQIKLPKGTIIKELKYKLDQPNHNLYLEAPIQI